METGLTSRRIVPEILDGLRTDDPRAIGSRRDLVHINALMFHVGLMARLLRCHVLTPRPRILELGAGDGTFMLKVARRLAARWPGVKLTLLDRVDLMTEQRRTDFAELGWEAELVTADVFDWLARAGSIRFDAIAANLFLHHFSDADLAHLLPSLQARTSAFLAAEPRRCRLALAACHLLPWIGANDVTLHDAPASVRAGFRGGEISKLWPHSPDSRVVERRAGPFSHIFAATDYPAMGQA